jgi:hypothetical protein
MAENEETKTWHDSHVVKEPRLLGGAGGSRRCHGGFFSLDSSFEGSGFSPVK